MATNYAKLYDEDMLENKNKQIAAVNDITAKNKQTITDNYAAQVKEAESAYDDQYRVNAVQKLINERQVAESMANMGLTDSGLNRTQQTAVQLSYANNKAKLDRQRQSAIDALNREMSAYITQADTKAASEIASIENTYAQNRQSYVAGREKADAEIAAAAIKASGEAASGKIAYGTLASTSYGANGNVVYTDTNGNSIPMRAGTNPYTGEVNKDALNEDGEYDVTRVFSNGYQPKYYNNKELKEVKGAAYSPSWRTDGKTQKVFSTDGGKTRYVWNGPENKYEQLVKINNTYYIPSDLPQKNEFTGATEQDFMNYFLLLPNGMLQEELAVFLHQGIIDSKLSAKILLAHIKK